MWESLSSVGNELSREVILLRNFRIPAEYTSAWESYIEKVWLEASLLLVRRG